MASWLAIVGCSIYEMPSGAPNTSVRLFYLAVAPNTPLDALSGFSRQVRTQTQTMRLALHVRLKALIARGTVDQIAQATQLVQQSKL